MDDAKLIELVSEHPCVFNPKHHMYKDANARENVWNEIGVAMKLTAKECKNRWKNIRDTYMRRKRAQKLPTGSASSKKLRKWHLEDYLQFLNVVDCERETVTNNITEVNEIEQDSQETENIELAVETNDPEIRDPEEGDEDLCEELEEHNDNGVSKQAKKRKPITKLSGESILKVFKKNSEERSKLLTNIINKQNEQPKEKHPIDVFFQSMAMTVKKFSPSNQIRARMEICQTVSQLELEEINQALNVHQYDGRSSSDSRSSALPSPSILDNNECGNYDLTLLSNSAGMTFR